MWCSGGVNMVTFGVKRAFAEMIWSSTIHTSGTEKASGHASFYSKNTKDITLEKFTKIKSIRKSH